MHGDSFFVDTNVLLYSLDSRDALKRSLANKWLDRLWRSGEGRLSWQVLDEFYANAVRKTGVSKAKARDTVMIFTRWKPGGMSAELLEHAWRWTDRAQLSWWDSLILASAERQGCRWLLSEDFQHGRDYGGVRAINPFEEPPAELVP